jgi:choloylglycine hydrolase
MNTSKNLTDIFLSDKFIGFIILLSLSVHSLTACTGIGLKAEDGSVIQARTVEWGLSDARHDRLVLIPRKHSFEALVPGDQPGMKWTGKYGFISMTAYGQDYGPDGLNEAGLYVGMFFFPGFAQYSPYDPALRNISISVGDYMQWILSSFDSVEAVKAHLESVRVVDVEDPRFGGVEQLPFHWKIADPSGATIIVEMTAGGKIEVFDALLGVVTNAPGYQWHLTNLRNYLGLSPKAHNALEFDGKSFSPLGSGTGMMGLPGDFSPASRFVRAAAFTASARPLATGEAAIFEAFRILDSFNLPLGTITAPDALPEALESSTQITSACDLKKVRFYYHTMRNRQVRMIDLNDINFEMIHKQWIDDDFGKAHRVRQLKHKW